MNIETLRTLGWSDDLIRATCQVAEQIPEALQSDHEDSEVAGEDADFASDRIELNGCPVVGFDHLY